MTIPPWDGMHLSVSGRTPPPTAVSCPTQTTPTATHDRRRLARRSYCGSREERVMLASRNSPLVGLMPLPLESPLEGLAARVTWVPRVLLPLSWFSVPPCPHLLHVEQQHADSHPSSCANRSRLPPSPLAAPLMSTALLAVPPQPKVVLPPPPSPQPPHPPVTMRHPEAPCQHLRWCRAQRS